MIPPAPMPPSDATERPLRLIMIATTYPRWAGDSSPTFVHDLAVGLTGLGWQVSVLAPHAEGAARHEWRDGIDIHRFRYWWPASGQTLFTGGGALAALRRNPLNGLKIPALVLAELLALWRLTAKQPTDLLQAHWIIPQGWVATCIAAARKIPCIVTVHGADVFTLRGWLPTLFKRHAVRRASAITANSSVSAAAVRAIAPNADVAPEIIPTGARPLPARSRQQPSVDVVAAGRLVPEKGFDTLIDAIARLRDQGRQVTVALVGAGDAGEALKAKASAAGLDRMIRFAGWADREQLADHFAAARLVAVPSRTASSGWQEALGLTAIEAQLAGLPVIATRCGGLVDVVRDGETGLLVPEDDPGALARAIARLLDDPALAARLAEAGKVSAMASLTLDHAARRFDALFRKTVAAHG